MDQSIIEAVIGFLAANSSVQGSVEAILKLPTIGDVKVLTSLSGVMNSEIVDETKVNLILKLINLSERKDPELERLQQRAEVQSKARKAAEDEIAALKLQLEEVKAELSETTALNFQLEEKKRKYTELIQELRATEAELQKSLHAEEVKNRRLQGQLSQYQEESRWSWQAQEVARQDRLARQQRVKRAGSGAARMCFQHTASMELTKKDGKQELGPAKKPVPAGETAPSEDVYIEVLEYLGAIRNSGPFLKAANRIAMDSAVPSGGSYDEHDIEALRGELGLLRAILELQQQKQDVEPVPGLHPNAFEEITNDTELFTAAMKAVVPMIQKNHPEFSKELILWLCQHGIPQYGLDVAGSVAPWIKHNHAIGSKGLTQPLEEKISMEKCKCIGLTSQG